MTPAWSETDYYRASRAARRAFEATDQQLSFGLSERAEDTHRLAESSGIGRDADWGNHQASRGKARSLNPTTLNAGVAQRPAMTRHQTTSKVSGEQQKQGERPRSRDWQTVPCIERRAPGWTCWW